MIRIGFGFLLGCLFTFYSFPLVQSAMTHVGVVEEKAKTLLEEEKPTYTLNPNPPISLVREQKFNASLEEADELKRIMKAVSISSTEPEQDKAPEFVVSLIKDLVKVNPNLGFFIRQRINNGINNKEALEIISKYVSEK